jgi:four helix bundle protein
MTTTIGSFRDLEVWQRGMDLVDLVYAATKSMPREEFELRKQIKKAVVSIPSNVAEGNRRKKKRPAYQNHVSIALGSQGELETQIEICKRNAFLLPNVCAQIFDLSDRVGAMLYKLHESLE